MDPAAKAAFASSLTPEQIAQTQWNIENTGRIAMYKFKVRKSEMTQCRRVLTTGLGSLRCALWAGHVEFLRSDHYPLGFATTSLP